MRIVASSDEPDMPRPLSYQRIRRSRFARCVGYHPRRSRPARRSRAAQQDRGVYFSGFAGVNTRWIAANEISFGAVPGSGVATSVGPRDVSTQFERQNWIDVMNLGLPPEDYDFGGISGGPMLSVIERQGLRTWSLAGVIYQGPNSSADDEKSIKGFEVIKARHASFIRPDGTLDRQIWSGGGVYLGGHEK